MDKTQEQIEMDFERDLVKALLQLLYDEKLIKTLDMKIVIGEYESQFGWGNSLNAKSNGRESKSFDSVC